MRYSNPKPVIVTGMWKRPEVFEIFKRHYQKIGLDVIVAGSEGETSKKLAEGLIYIETPNEPLGDKMNATTLKALELGYTHAICVGSDDLISEELLTFYVTLMKRGFDFIGVTDFYFYDLETGKSAYWGGYRERYRFGHTAGAGRVLSESILNDWNGTPWTNELSRYLDTAMQNKLNASGRHKKIFSLKQHGLYAVDIKSSENMTPFKLWDNTNYIDEKEITSRFDVRNISRN